jgi:hypothetical protein
MGAWENVQTGDVNEIEAAIFEKMGNRSASDPLAPWADLALALCQRIRATKQPCVECGGTGMIGTGTPSGEGGEDFDRCPGCVHEGPRAHDPSWEGCSGAAPEDGRGRRPYPVTPTCGAVKDVPLLCTLDAGHDGPHACHNFTPTIYWQPVVGTPLTSACPACESPEKWGNAHAPWCHSFAPETNGST